jgi:hypothetical protein
MKSDLYVFLHIQKTGGDSLHKHIHKNMTPDDAVWLDLPQLGLPAESVSYQKYLSATDNFFLRRGRVKNNKIRLIYGHSVPWGLARAIGREAAYITLFRDPIARIISDYNYLTSMYFNDGPAARGQLMYKKRLLVDGEMPDFEEWFEAKFEKIDYNLSCISTYHTLKLLGYIEPRESLRSVIDKFYFVGITENYARDSLYFYKFLKFNKFFMRQNVSRKYVGVAKNSKQWKKMYRVLHKDYEIYELACEHNKKFKLQHKEMESELNRIYFERKFLMPFHQVVYDLPQTVHLSSAYLREKMPGYSGLVDKLKGELK